MDTHIDFLQFLPSDLSLNIVERLDDSYDILHASAVSRSWHHFVLVNGLCKQLCVRMCPELSRVDRVIEPRPAADAAQSCSMEWETCERDHRVYASFSRALTAFTLSDCIAHAVSASSTDNDPQESIINTLDPRDRILETPSYWSSKGQNDPGVPETLLYKLTSDLCVITEIDIKPFEVSFPAYFQSGNPVYSANFVRFRFGHPKSARELEGDLMHLPLKQPADDKFIWTYTSQEFTMSHVNDLQKFKLPNPVLCIGGFLQIELSGRVQRQEMDGLFYICVTHVQVIGRSLFPAFAVENLDLSGNFSLKYCPLAFGHCLLSTSNGETRPALPPPLPVEEMMWGHLEGLVAFLMRRDVQGED